MERLGMSDHYDEYREERYAEQRKNKLAFAYRIR